jgi:YVTN family beta-propeller protein
LTKTIKTGEEPDGVTVSADGKFVYSTNEADGAVTVIDIAAEKLIKTIKLGRRPRNVVFTADGRHAWVNAENDGSKLYASTGRGKMVFVIDTATNKPGASFEVGQRPCGIAS